jgi:dihydrofolate synthase / folylpolyglutamate synthase
MSAGKGCVSLDDWLSYIEQLHPRAIDMGLERVSRVRDAMSLAPGFPVLTVGGTNGKGSICSMLEAMLGAAGYKVGLYTSPHLLRYNERVRIGRREAEDDALAGAFSRVEASRGETPLTYFEMGTLAAVDLFQREAVDVAVLEVGLGGRLDAVNAFDPDCAVIASIGIDHIEFLGPTRESIGFEKAGIMRRGRPAVCGDEDPPASLLQHAAQTGASLRLISRDFGFSVQDAVQWQYWSTAGKRSGLPYPALRGPFQLGNAAVAIAALESVSEQLPVDMGAVRRGLLEVALPGRLQILPGRPQIVLDVGHNPHAARSLAQALLQMPKPAKTIAIFGMLADKDSDAVAAALRQQVDHWVICPLDTPRSADVRKLADSLTQAGVDPSTITVAAAPGPALKTARELADENDRILAFGSFYTVSGVLQAIDAR